MKNGKRVTVNSQLYTIDSSVPANEETSNIINEWIEKLQEQFNKPLFRLYSEIDTRSTIVKQQETNIGNFIIEAIRLYYNADIGMTNSGGIRTDCIIPRGVVSLGVIKRMFPFDYSLALVKIKGKDLEHVINSTLQDYPKLTGAFPNITGIIVEASPNSNNVFCVTNLIDIQTGEKIDPNKEFVVVTRIKLIEGLDKWDFKNYYDYIDLNTNIENILISMFEYLYEKGGFENLWDDAQKFNFSIGKSSSLGTFLQSISIKGDGTSPLDSYLVDISSVKKEHIKINK